VTSWYRSHARNAAKGGVANSLHTTGAAVDVVYDTDSQGPTDIRPPPLDDLRAIATAYFVEVIREKDHDHFESRLAHLAPRRPDRLVMEYKREKSP
jgi:D-alanyl-D-alanine dipeptidase